MHLPSLKVVHVEHKCMIYLFLFENESTANAIAPPVSTKTLSTFLSTKKSNKQIRNTFNF